MDVGRGACRRRRTGRSEGTAARVARSALPSAPAWLEQAGAFADGRRHPGDVDLSVAFVGAVPVGTLSSPGEDAAWFPVSELQPLAPRQRAIVRCGGRGVAGAAGLRAGGVPDAAAGVHTERSAARLRDPARAPVAQGELPPGLAWGGAGEPTDEWRSEKRGRARLQLFRHATKRRRSAVWADVPASTSCRRQPARNSRAGAPPSSHQTPCKPLCKLLQTPRKLPANSPQTPGIGASSYSVVEVCGPVPREEIRAEKRGRRGRAWRGISGVRGVTV